MISEAKNWRIVQTKQKPMLQLTISEWKCN